VRRPVPVLVLTIAVAAAVPLGAAQARTPAPRLTAVRCVPASASTCTAGVRVRIGRQVQLRGSSLALGMRVTFRWSRGAIATRLHRGRPGWVARVPPGVAAGTVALTVRDRAGRRSNALRVRVLAAPRPAPPAATSMPGGPLPAVFAGTGMWIWQLAKSEGGDLDAIAARARATGIGTVLVKAADGTGALDQFSDLLVAGLHARGLRVCAWQYVYGSDPEGEARVAAAAIAKGSDCFVIDAETHYEGRYAEAQRYMATLRAAVGGAYPIALTSFPYVDYHRSLPYSVFLGPGGAQANLPQVYWKSIGGTVDAVSAHAFAHNRIYPAALAPLGQSYDDPPPEDLQRFRAIWASYGAGGLSWWSWQATTPAGWTALAAAPPASAAVTDPGWPALGKGALGDEVIWLQEHLTARYPTVTVTGKLDDATVAALKDFQTTHGIPVTGTTDPSTWQQVLTLPVTPVDWTAAPAAKAAAARAASAHRREIPPPSRRG
jgi:Putative peptidoglycan binding domain